MLRPEFHSAAFLAHLSSGIDAILIANLHYILLCVSIQQGIFAIFGCSVAAAVLLHVFDTFFFFSFACVNLFIGLIHERDVTVLVAN